MTLASVLRTLKGDGFRFVVWAVALPMACTIGCTATTRPAAGSAQYEEPSRPLGLRFVRLPRGEFTMGSPEGEASTKELQQLELQRLVSIDKAVMMSVHEITNEQFSVFVSETGLQRDRDNDETAQSYKGVAPDLILKAGDLPVVEVSWHEANAFCAWLSDKTGKTYRLPTAAEWEYACRANSQTVYSFGNSAFDLSEYAWYRDNADGRRHPVGEKNPNKWGLYDMHGNVWEWCSDIMPAECFEGTPFEGQQVATFRGGSYINSAPGCRSAAAWAGFPVDRRDRAVGFRIVCEVE